MSIKDLFGKRSNQIFTVEKYVETVERNGESLEHVDEHVEDKTRFVPRITVDFDDPKTFAKYGSAEKYYLDAINSVLNTYPYDGSLAEKTAWHNGATYVDNYIFENEYPRTTGYISINDDENHATLGATNIDGVNYRHIENAQFIYIKGGPHPTPDNKTGELIREYPEKLGKSNIWNPNSQRESNLLANGHTGNTVEFWFKLNEPRNKILGTGCLFDLWNNHDVGTEQYGRFLVELPEDSISAKPALQVSYVSGSFGIEREEIGEWDNIPDNFDFNKWNHFAVSVFNGLEDLTIRFYLNGELIEEKNVGTPVGSFIGETNHLTATIGALQTKPVETDEELYGTSPLRSSYDEFRFWKSLRNSEQIGRNWISQVHGGANTDEANIDLGVYYKFNEGVVDPTSTVGYDPQVLDYSGRISNGVIINYDTEVRNTGSAIDEVGVYNKEFKDPIMYRVHPDVLSLIEKKKLEGFAHDTSNNAAIYNTMPEWITTEDDESAGGNLLDLTQVISSYFDTLHLQIEALPSLTDAHYVQDGEKPLPFAKHLLASVGFVAPEIFVDSTILEELSNRNEERVFEEKLHNVKNLIYQNIYNNLTGIYKAKGTEKAFRNLLRCFGVGDQLIKINLYGDGVTHQLRDSYRSVSIKKHYLDFNNVDRHDSTVCQHIEPDNDISTSYLSGTDDGSLDFIPFTLETSVIFPKKLEIDHPHYYPFDFGFTEDAPASLFGMHEAKEDPEDLSWVDEASSDFGFRVVSIKEEDRSLNAKFRLDVRGFGELSNSDNGYHTGLLETDYFYDVYDNERWNFAVRIRMDKSPDLVHDSEVDVKYYLEFYGVSMLLDDVQNEFLHSKEITAEAAKSAMNANKRIYLGAEYDGFVEDLINKSDVKVGEVRYWQDYLDDETIKYHAKDASNYGVRDPYKPAYFNQTSTDRRVPQIDTLALYWDFSTVTSASPSDGIAGVGNILSDSYFYIDDVSGGTNAAASNEGRYSWLGKILKKQHTGKGSYYYPNDKEVVDRNFLFAAKQNLPEIIGSSDTINILNQDDEYFVRGTKPVNYFWAIEKSMYQSISDEVVNAFAGIQTFNNLIGDPVNRYRMEYKALNKLRQLFFQKFDNEPKVERYVRFYKWLDSSINTMIQELIPASANFSEDMRTMIESHVLERNKYWTKFPTIEMKQDPPEAPILGINEMLYNWKFGHASVEESSKCLWWKKRAERDGILSVGDEEADEVRKQILHVATTKNDGSYINRTLAKQVPGGVESYDGSTFVLRNLSSPYRFSAEPSKVIHGGVNTPRGKNIDFVRAETTFGTDNTVSVGEITPLANETCDDFTIVSNPLLRRKLNIEAGSDKYELGSEENTAKGSLLSLYELQQDLETGEKYWGSNHTDTYGNDKDVPMQGIFTDTHVGGLQNRHTPLNTGNDDVLNRPEAWTFDVTGEGEGYFAGPDFHNLHAPRAQHYRDEKAKRPINVRNIKTELYNPTLGNYGIEYEIVQTSGRSGNNRWFNKIDGLDVQNTYGYLSPQISGLYDFILPDRGRSSHVFVERFSAPGSPDTLSRGVLDVEAEEFAVYNNINFRNLDVRVHLNQWLTYHSRRWGYRSWHRGVPVLPCWDTEREEDIMSHKLGSPGDVDVFCEASFHKVHRNTAYRPESFDYIEYDSWAEEDPSHHDPCDEDSSLDANSITNYRCKETHDNYWVQHQLPRSGFQYSWINASTQKSILENVDGVAKSYKVCPWGYATNYPNATAYHVEIETDPLASTAGVPTYSKMVVEKELHVSEYCELDSSCTTIVYERVKTEHGFPFLTKFIKLDKPRHPKTYETTSIIDKNGVEVISDLCNEQFAGVPLLGGNIEDPTIWKKFKKWEAYMKSGATVPPEMLSLNDLLLHRNGPYQHPTWKQIRNNENSLVVKQRKNNIISVSDQPEVLRIFSDRSSNFAKLANTSGRLITFRRTKAETAKNYIEPVVSWNVPMQSKLGFYGSPSAGTIVHTYSNNLEVFANPFLEQRIGLEKSVRQVYDSLSEKYLDKKNSTAPTLYELKYSEYIFPKHRNASLSKVRGRSHYGEEPGYGPNGYDRRTNKIRTFWGSEQNRLRTKWVVPSNVPDESETVARNALGAPIRRSSVWALEYNPELGEEEGFNVALRGDLVWSGYAQHRGYIYEGVSMDTSTPELEGTLATQTPNLDMWLAPRPLLQHIHNPHSIKAQENAWTWRAPMLSGNSPWYETYGEFSKDVRSIGQNYSVVPEFNISSHMEYYINKKGGNFRTENKNMLEMTGIAGALTGSANHFITQDTFFSWNGSDVINQWVVEPNFADGWQDLFAGNLKNTSPSAIGSENPVPSMKQMCIMEPPVPIDLESNHWKCSDEYPVAYFNREKFLKEDPILGTKEVTNLLRQFMQVDFSESARLATDGASKPVKGLGVGTAPPISWGNISDSSTSSMQSTLLLERWENSALISFWINLKEVTDLPIGCFSLKSGTLKQAPHGIRTLARADNGKFVDLKKIQLSLKSAQDKQNKLKAEILKLGAVKITNATAQKTIASKIEAKTQKYKKYDGIITDLHEMLEKTTAKEPSLSKGRNYISSLFLKGYMEDHVYWADDYGNKIIFDITVGELERAWNHISLYYIGGGKGSQTQDRFHRVVLFVNGKKINSTMAEESINHFAGTLDLPPDFDYETSQLPLLCRNGSLLRNNEPAPVTFTNMIFGKTLRSKKAPNIDGHNTMRKDWVFRGKTTDLAVFRGNPGITRSPHDYDSLHNSDDNKWFLDNTQESTAGNFYSSLTEFLYDNQCEDINDIHEEWRDIMTVCKPYPPSIFTFVSLTPFPLDFSSIKFTGTKEDSEADSFKLIFPDASIKETEDGELLTGLTQPFFMPLVESTADEGFVNIAGSGQLLEEANEFASEFILEDHSHPSDTPSELEIDEVVDEVPEEAIPSNHNSECSELIGWWKLGVPQWKRETCESYVWKEDFFKCYSHTDKIAHIEKVREDHKDLGVDARPVLRLEVDAIKKLLPYNGFYPSQRATQLGGLFYDCIVPYVEGDNDEQSYDRARTEQAALQPFFAPGILFNTIKSGLAVDWATYAGELSSTKNDMRDLILGITGENDDAIKAIDKYFHGTTLGNVIRQDIANQLHAQVSLGRLRTNSEKQVFISRQYGKSLKRNKDQIKDFTRSLVNECSQQEYEKYVATTGEDPKAPSTITAFKKSYRCAADFSPGSSKPTRAISERQGSAIGIRRGMSPMEISPLAQNALNELNAMPETVVTGTQNPTTENKEGRWLNTEPSYRIPFEGLVSLNSFLPQKNSFEESKIFFLAPSYYSGDPHENNKYPYFEWTGVQNPLYEMAMHNFLAEVPNFFLKNNRFTTFASSPENKFKPVKKGWTYYMDVHLYKTDDFGMTCSPHDGELYPLPTDAGGNPFTTEGRYFGPAVRYQTESDLNEDEFGNMPLADPAQAPYVPPYFYGRAKARLKYVAQIDGQPSLEDIFNNLEIDYINEEMDELFSSRSSSETVSASDIFLAASDFEAWSSTPAYKARMPIESCVKFDGKTNKKNIKYSVVHSAYEYDPTGENKEIFTAKEASDNTDGTGVWVISPRFECPTLNFKTSENLATRSKNKSGTGIWGGYGTIPTDEAGKEQGLFISLEESFKKHLSPSVPLMCTTENVEEDTYTVALGLRKDVRYMHENVITLEDPFGNSQTITIGQPQDHDNIEPCTSVIYEQLAAAIGIVADDAPYSANKAIRTVGSALESRPNQLAYNGMGGEYDIEAYFQAESWIEDPFQLWTQPGSTVPDASDVANAITYHINYRYNTDKNFPWRAKVRWINENLISTAQGASAQLENIDKSTDTFYSNQGSFRGGVYSVVEVEYIDKGQGRGQSKVNKSPIVSISTNQDSFRNPLGRLGIRYLADDGTEDRSYDSLDPETQVKREFYPRATTESITSCIRAVGSLIDVCGFQPAKSKVGEVADKKEISEAIIMIPFVDNPVSSKSYAPTTQVAGRNFFKISKRLYNLTKTNIESGNPAIAKGTEYNVDFDVHETSVSNMIKKMQKYNLPPQFDFIKYGLSSGEDPFVMYVFEFTEELKQADLAAIWQGLMPQCAVRAKKEEQVIEHELNEINFFEGRKIPQDVRWMTFKVKRKAKTNYYKMTADSADDDRFKFDFEFGSDLEPEYSYNWPYDFCSLVELARVKGGISILPPNSILPDIKKREIRVDKLSEIATAHAAAGKSTGDQKSGLVPWSIGEDDE